MLKKGNKSYAILKMKCPRCHEADLFPTGTFEFKNPFDMHRRCTNCDQDFMPEPGFYYGAMFISYAISVILLLPMTLLLVFYFKWSFNAAMGLVVILTLVLFLKILRLSRSIWIHIMVPYVKQ